MKIPKFLNEEEYERRLNWLVRRHQEHVTRIETHTIKKPNSKYSRLYKAFLESDVPMTAREAALKARWPFYDNQYQKMRYRVGVERFEREGWLVKVDRVKVSWKTRNGSESEHMIWRWMPNPDHTEGQEFRIKIATEKLLAEVDKLDAMRIHGICITSVVESKPIDNRSDEIFNLRSQGLSYQEIGDAFGISRERIRQLIERVIIRNINE